MRHVSPNVRCVLGTVAPNRRHCPRGAAAPPPRFEAVEARRLLAASIVLDANGIVVANGTDAADTLKAERVGFDDVRITVNSSLTRTFDLDDILGVRLNALGGNDNVSTTGSILLSGEVILNGGAGTDTLTSRENVRFQEGEVHRANGRTIATRQADGGLLVFGTAGADTIDIFASREVDGERVDVNDEFNGAFGTGQFAYYAVNAGAGNDNLGAFGPFNPPIRLNGQDGNDGFFVDGATRTTVAGGAGNDRVRVSGSLNGLQGFDGGTGTDTIDMDNDEAGIDLNQHPGVENVDNAEGTVVGNALDNRIVAGDGGPVTVRAGAGNDTVFGSVGNDSLFGEAGNDALYGNEGNDLLDGGPGTDQLDGGPGDDTTVGGEVAPPPPRIFIASDRTLTADGTVANDLFGVVRVGADDVIVTVNDLSRRFDMDDFDAIRFNGGDGNDSMGAGAGVADVTMVGGGGNDRLEGNDLAGVLRGGSGNDTLLGNGGVDALFGEAGIDLLIGGDGDDFLDGGDDGDRLRGEGGADRMIGGNGNDVFEADDGIRDTLDGGAGFDGAAADAIDEVTNVENRVGPAA